MTITRCGDPKEVFKKIKKEVSKFFCLLLFIFLSLDWDIDFGYMDM